MKTTILLATLLAAGTGQATAQHAPETEKRIKAHQALVNNMLQAQSSQSIALKPTGTKYRVIAQAGGNIDETSDSSAIIYSAERGSRYIYDNTSLYYGERLEENAYAPIPILQVSNNQGLFFTNAPASLQADSIKFFSGDFLPVRTATYRPDNKITVTNLILDGTTNRKVNVYNSQGYVTAVYTMSSSDGLNFDTTNRRTFSYNNTFTRVATDTIYIKHTGAGTFTLDNVLQYHYSSTNRLDSVIAFGSILSPLARIIDIRLSYYPDNKLQKLVFTDKTVPGMTIKTVDSMGYTPGSDYATYRSLLLTIDDVNLGSTTAGSRQILYPGANGLPDSARYFMLPEANAGWVPGDKVVYSYTSFGEPDSLLLYKPGGSLDAKIRFYYETYESTPSGIQSIAAAKDVTVYPNPFRNKLFVDWKTDRPATATIQLLNITGQEVYRERLQLSPGSNVLRLPDLGSGNYILLLHDEKGKTWSSKVVRQ